MIQFVIVATFLIVILLTTCIYLGVSLFVANNRNQIDGYEDNEHDEYAHRTIEIPKRVNANERLLVEPDGASMETKQTKCVKKDKRIPRTIMQSNSTNVLKYRMAKAVENMLSVNENYEYAFYDDDDAIEFMKEHCTPRVLEAFNAVRPGAYKCDIFRLAYLLVKGGWYADIYFHAIKPLDTLEDQDLYVVHDGPNPNSLSVFQALIGTVPNNPVIGYILDRIVDRVLSDSYEPESVLSLTGPIAFGTFLRDFYHPNQMTLEEGVFEKYTMMHHGEDRMIRHKGVPYFRAKYNGWVKDRDIDMHYGEMFAKGLIYTDKDPRKYRTTRDGPIDRSFMNRVIRRSSVAKVSEIFSENSQNKLTKE